MNPLFAAALRYAELGYRVFPCAPGSKEPLTERGFHDASTDVGVIESWWHFHPSANVAIATDGLIVLDVDGDANEWLTTDRALDLAVAPLCRTASGGRHYYFRQPAQGEYRGHAGRLAPHVDVRANGGYAVVPPSVLAGGKTYRWAEDMALDAPPDRLPEPPAWFVEALDQLAASPPTAAHVASGAAEANTIPDGQRNATLARLAGTMRRVGMAQAEIVAALHVTNNTRCSPPLDADEVERIAASVARYEPDQITVAVVEDHWSQMKGKSADKPSLAFLGITSKELATAKYELNYLIDGILVQRQPGVLAGPKKTLKTNISVDLAISLAQGGYFLNRFAVAKPTRVGVMSGESGAATIQETARRIAKSKDFTLEDCENAFWCFDVPQLGNVLHTDALKAFIERHALEVLILDPTYLMMTSIGDDAGNLFVVGSLLKSLADLAQQTGITPLLCHHLKKGVADPYEPAELENIAWAGFQEFVRQWILLNRRVRYDPDRGGHHELWMSVGGSAGHSANWGLNIDEGTRQDEGGRRWDVEILTTGEAYTERESHSIEAQETRKQRSQQVRDDRNREAVLRALHQYPDGETPRVLREAAGVSGRVIQDQLEQLEMEMLVERCTVQKHTRREPAWRLIGHGGTGGTCWDSPTSPGTG
ncbi:MAG: hypothetical protein DCC68_25720 [Planctomycetota bacterium]|nr:MAG: hypothetical protein DCC68_25720 [Planctomycetota bacterium]